MSTAVEELGDCIKVGRRGSLSGMLIVEGRQGHVAYPHRAENPLPDISALITAIDAQPLDSGNALFQPSNLEFVSIDVGNKAWNVIPAQASLKVDCRVPPGLGQDHAREKITEVLGEDGWSIEFDEQVVGNRSPIETPLMDVIRAWVEDVLRVDAWQRDINAPAVIGGVHLECG